MDWFRWVVGFGMGSRSLPRRRDGGDGVSIAALRS